MMITTFLIELTFHNNQLYVYPIFGLWTFSLQTIQAVFLLLFSVFYVAKYVFDKKIFDRLPLLFFGVFLLFTVIITYLQAIRINTKLHSYSPTIPPI